MMYGNSVNYDYSRVFMGGWMGTWLGFFLLPLVIWSLFWKGWALWVSARNGNKGWFIALLILNTAGILDILYIFLFGKETKKSGSSPKRKK